MAVENKSKKNKKIVASDKKNSNFFKGLKGEFKRITWAPKEEVKKATASVVVFCFVYVVIIGLLDNGFNNFYKMIFK